MKLKKLMILSLGIFMGASLASCGGETETTPTTTTGTPATTTTTQVTPTTTTTGGGSSTTTTTTTTIAPVKINLTKTFVLEENNAFYGAMNVIVKDNVLDSVTMLLGNYPVVIKPVYVNNTIDSFTFASVGDGIFYNIKLTDSFSISGIKLTKTTNGFKISNLANTIWCEVKNNFTFESSNTIYDISTKTFADGTVVNTTQNSITVEKTDRKYEYIFNGLNFDINFYRDDVLSGETKLRQDATNPLKLSATNSYDDDDEHGFIVRDKEEYELYEDYTIKNNTSYEYEKNVYGLKIKKYTEYEKTDKGYNMNIYNVLGGKKVIYVSAACECLDGTNIPTKSAYSQSGQSSVVTVTYNDDLRPISQVMESPYMTQTMTYTYDNIGNRTSDTESREMFSLDANNNKVIDYGTKEEKEYDSFGNVIRMTSSEYNTTSKAYEKKSETLITYDSTGKYQLSNIDELYENGKIAGGHKQEKTYDDDYNLTKEVHYTYNATDEKYYKESEETTTYESGKTTTIAIGYGEKETNPTTTKTEKTTSENETVTIYSEYDTTTQAYVKKRKLVKTIGQNGLDETELSYEFDGDTEILKYKGTIIYGQNGLDYVHTSYNVDGTTETVVAVDTYRYDSSERLIYHKDEELYVDKDDPSIANLVQRTLEEYEYNANGDYTKYLHVDNYDDGSPMKWNRRSYEYDSSFRLIKEDSYAELTGTDIDYTYTYEYLKDGDNDKIVNTNEYFNFDYKTVTTIIKNDNGLVSKKNDVYNKVNSEYVLTQSRGYYYDEYLDQIKEEQTNYQDGKRTSYKSKETVYNDNTLTIIVIDYSYDEDGKVTSGNKDVSEDTYTKKSILSEKYTYDTTLEDFVITERVSYTYDTNNNKTEGKYEYYTNGELDSRSYKDVYTYNENNKKATDKKYRYNTTTKEYDLIAYEITPVYDANGSFTTGTTKIEYEYTNTVLKKKTTFNYDPSDGYIDAEYEEYKYDSNNELTNESRKVRFNWSINECYISNWDPTTKAWGTETTYPIVS